MIDSRFAKGSQASMTSYQFRARASWPGTQGRDGDNHPRWRAVNAPHLVALVRVGVTFEGGKFVQRLDNHTQPRGA